MMHCTVLSSAVRYCVRVHLTCLMRGNTFNGCLVDGRVVIRFHADLKIRGYEELEDIQNVAM